jgi:ATP-binding cassette subfamily F protein 3
MAFAQFSKISCSFGAREVLRDVSVVLNNGTKAALAGANGSGKTTLLKIMAGIAEPDDGERSVEKGARISYLPQSGIVHRGSTLRDEADKAFMDGYEIEREREQIGDVLRVAPDSPDAQRLLSRHQELTDKLEDSQWHRRGERIERVLTGLGFSPDDFDRAAEEFSGGWQMRIALAKTLLEDPDILLLDEPTNYLDLEARNWLEQFLLEFKGGFLLVSHDRYFLDVTIDCVYELFNGELRRYPGNYSRYEKTREAELEQLVERYERQQEEIRRLEDFVRRFSAKPTKAAQAQERKKMLEKMERIEIPEPLKRIHFTFPPAPHSGRIALTANCVTKSYDGETRVIDSLDLVVEKGDRLVVAGKNGAGKTTLLRILAGNDGSFDGAVKPGAGVAIGYFSQDSAEFLEESGGQTVLDFIERQMPSAESFAASKHGARDLLGAFLFRGDDVFKNIGVLSGGEKSRIALLSLLLRPVNLLILDEPTNHLDLYSKDVLLRALKDFGGTVVFVSHDRGFIESLATRVLELRAGMPARFFPGGYGYYLEQTADGEGGVLGAQAPRRRGYGENPKGLSLGGGLSPSLSQAKTEKSERRKLEREEARLMQEITDKEAEKVLLQIQLSLPDVYSDYEKSAGVQNNIDALVREIEELSARWEEVSASLGKKS